MAWYLRGCGERAPKKAKIDVSDDDVQELPTGVTALSDCSGAQLTPGNWYHKPGPYDLTPEEFATLPTAQQTDYKLVESVADFGPELEQYCEGDEEEDEEQSSDEGGEGEEDDGEPVLEECKMVLVVRQDLKMGKGKIGIRSRLFSQVSTSFLIRTVLLS
jgi:hypothetical protein